MMRIAGILLGSLLMLACFLLLLDSGHDPHPVEAGAGGEHAVQTDAAVSLASAVEPVGGEEDPVEAAVADVADTVLLPDAGETPAAVAGDAGLVLDPRVWNQVMGAGDMIKEADTAASSRYLVWTPFRSQWAAEGFARRLTLATDVPVEVVNETSGDYQVVFRYRDEAERQTMIRQIETVTGLELEP